MICFDCPNTAICKIFDTVMKAKPYVDIHIKGCQIKLPENFRHGDSEVVTKKTQPRTPEEILEISEKIKEMQQSRQEDLPPEEEDDSDDLKMCQICSEYIIYEHFTCVECGREICQHCNVESADDRKIYCTDCF